ncbi:MAG: hypothetical protein ABJC12_05470 [Saprospiraceae bacterium]
MRTAVLFGAGASIEAIPTIDEMQRHIPHFLQRLNDPQVHSLTKFPNELKYLITLLEKFCESLKLTQTPDVTLRKLFFSEKNFEPWLKMYWIYFNILQTGKRSDIGLAPSQKFRSYGFTDKDIHL